MQAGITPHFRRQFKKLPPALQEEAMDRIELFGDIQNHESLKVHKLHGALSGKWSFSVNYKYRIMFAWEIPQKSAVLMSIGDHSLYQ